MCNLYTYRLSRDEIRGLLEHYKLIGKEWEEALRTRNEPTDVYPTTRRRSPWCGKVSG